MKLTFFLSSEPFLRSLLAMITPIRSVSNTGSVRFDCAANRGSSVSKQRTSQWQLLNRGQTCSAPPSQREKLTVPKLITKMHIFIFGIKNIIRGVSCQKLIEYIVNIVSPLYRVVLCSLDHCYGATICGCVFNVW